MAYIYGIERWDEVRDQWVPQRFLDCHDLEQVGDLINLLEQILPHREFRPAQYAVGELHRIVYY